MTDRLHRCITLLRFLRVHTPLMFCFKAPSVKMVGKGQKKDFYYTTSGCCHGEPEMVRKNYISVQILNGKMKKKN